MTISTRTATSSSLVATGSNLFGQFRTDASAVTGYGEAMARYRFFLDASALVDQPVGSESIGNSGCVRGMRGDVETSRIRHFLQNRNLSRPSFSDRGLDIGRGNIVKSVRGLFGNRKIIDQNNIFTHAINPLPILLSWICFYDDFDCSV